MLRVVMLAAVAVAMAGAGFAQTPAEPAKKTMLLLELSSGENVLLLGPKKRGGELCGEIRRKNGARSQGCVATKDVRSAQFADPKALVLSGVRGGLCVALAPVCFGLMTRAAENGAKAMVEKKS